ncbi:glycosyltransferase family 21 protein [Lasiosphaeria miniovina]|uniref:Ceramide glucosyltransferase n=1 Tax=Lasiosphaeria miniovina TaxID=1954250 RepID=A0AA40B4V8_9PEZI|nr:glycosyltransferase family 21 protein [Lasiosphaeria miniovina]KAK0727726.1 glycosyltransferase family 21 protein [Lasiosphaeria miniovina]
MPVSDVAMSLIVQGAALVSLVWSLVVITVSSTGIYKLVRHNRSPPSKPVSPLLDDNQVPHITLIRPAKGVEVGLYECLASTFRQAYPKTKLTIHLCVASTDDPAYPILRQVVADFPDADARLFVEEDDPVLHGVDGHVNSLGPNPKVRNISRAYREAKGDVIWIMDCNVWVSRYAAGRLIDKLFGFRPGGAKTAPYRFVHQLPLVVDIETQNTEEAQTLLTAGAGPAVTMGCGGRLEEMFLATTHAKFYNGINGIGIAPCVLGKSNMFRKSHLERLTDFKQNLVLSPSDASRGRGIDFFSSYICEDHLIGDLFFKSQLPGFQRHGLVFGEVAVQPTSGMSVAAYIARRVRWLRVRKWTVIAATLVEPGVESFLCSLHISFALTTLPWFHDVFAIPQTWGAMGTIWASTMIIWVVLDYLLTSMLFRLQSLDVDENTPAFARGTSRQGGTQARPFLEWLLSWLGRELLALPIWTWAVLLGTTVSWRGNQFKVRMDMSVVEIEDEKRTTTPRSRSKDRVD